MSLLLFIPIQTLVSRSRLLSVRKSSTLCYFEAKHLPACLKGECLREGLRDPKHCTGQCDQTLLSPLVLDDAFAHNVLTRLRSLEHDRDEAIKDRDEVIKEKEKIQSLVFLGDLYIWMRDTVLNKAVTDTPMLGELMVIDGDAEGALNRYLPAVVNYVALGKGKVFHTYSDDVESNFIKFEAYAQDVLKVDLRAVFKGIYTRHKTVHMHISFAPHLQKINTRTGLAQLSLFLETVQHEKWPDRVVGADKAQVAIMMQLLQKYLINGEEEATRENKFIACSQKSGRW